MRYLVWVLRLLVFLLVLLFALKNTDPVDVRFFADQVLTGVPLIVVMLASFVVGLLFAVLVLLPAAVRRRREIRRLRRELTQCQESVRQPSGSQETVAPETVAPMAPL